MTIGMAVRLSWVGVVMLGSFAGRVYAGDDAEVAALSQAMGRARLFAGLTVAERIAVESAATLRRCPPGARLIEQGKPLDRMFFILEGQVEVRVNGKLVATDGEQSLVGEMEFLDKSPACADVITSKETLLIELNNAALTALMEKQPRLGYGLMSEMARIEAGRLRAMNPK